MTSSGALKPKGAGRVPNPRPARAGDPWGRMTTSHLGEIQAGLVFIKSMLLHQRDEALPIEFPKVLPTAGSAPP